MLSVGHPDCECGGSAENRRKTLLRTPYKVLYRTGGYDYMLMPRNTTETCPVCGKTAMRIEQRQSIGETVTIYRHSAWQFDEDVDVLACTDVTTHEHDHDAVKECPGTGCDATIPAEDQACTHECYLSTIQTRPRKWGEA